MECRNAEDLLERLADSEDTFAHAGSSTKQDERVNDGNNYAGLMRLGDYKDKRAKMAETHDPKANQLAAVAAARAKVTADRDAADRAAQEREEREAARRDRLKRTLTTGAEGGGGAAAEGDAGAGDTKPAATKKKKKKAAAPTLSFDAEEEG